MKKMKTKVSAKGKGIQDLTLRFSEGSVYTNIVVVCPSM